MELIKITLDVVHLMDDGRLFPTWRKFCNCGLFGQPDLFFFAFIVSIYSIILSHFFYESKILSSGVFIIAGTIRSPHEILSNFSSATLRSHARGRPRGRAQDQCFREKKYTFFLAALESSAGSVNLRPAQESVLSLDAAPRVQLSVVLEPRASSTSFRRRSQRELVQRFSGQSEIPLERIV